MPEVDMDERRTVRIRHNATGTEVTVKVKLDTPWEKLYDIWFKATQIDSGPKFYHNGISLTGLVGDLIISGPVLMVEISDSDRLGSHSPLSCRLEDTPAEESPQRKDNALFSVTVVWATLEYTFRVSPRCRVKKIVSRFKERYPDVTGAARVLLDGQGVADLESRLCELRNTRTARLEILPIRQEENDYQDDFSEGACEDGVYTGRVPEQIYKSENYPVETTLDARLPRKRASRSRRNTRSRTRRISYESPTPRRRISEGDLSPSQAELLEYCAGKKFLNEIGVAEDTDDDFVDDEEALQLAIALSLG